jgi:chemotaxis protein MotB
MSIKRKKIAIPSVWMTVYGDFITNLTLFFLLLFASVLLALQKGFSREQLTQFMQGFSAAAYQEEKKEDVNLTDLKGKMEKIEGIAGVSIKDKEVRIVLQEAVLFDPGRAQLKGTAKELLTRIGTTLPQHPNRIVVEGHTCNLPLKQKVPANFQKWQMAQARSTGLGPFNSNWELSGARSIQVVDFFIKKKLIGSDILIASACGPAEPLVPNNSEENRAKNRRIELKVLYNK